MMNVAEQKLIKFSRALKKQALSVSKPFMPKRILTRSEYMSAVRFLSSSPYYNVSWVKSDEWKCYLNMYVYVKGDLDTTRIEETFSQFGAIYKNDDYFVYSTKKNNDTNLLTIRLGIEKDQEGIERAFNLLKLYGIDIRISDITINTHFVNKDLLRWYHKLILNDNPQKGAYLQQRLDKSLF